MADLRRMQLRRSSSVASSLTAVVSDQCDSTSDDDFKSATAAAVASDAGVAVVEKFMLDETPQLHPLFTTPKPTKAQHNESSSRLSYENQKAVVNPVRWKLHRNLERQERHFYNVVEAYRKLTKDNPLPREFDLRETHTWEQVYQASQRAERQSTQEELTSSWKWLGRRSQRASITVCPWLELVPNGNYTSAICGGLKIAFKVAGRMKEKRAAILDTLRSIPETVRLAEDRLEDYSNDAILYDTATELYLAILAAIEGMLRWLVDKSIWKKIGSILAEPLFEKPVDVGISDVQEQTAKLRSRAATLQSKAIGGIDGNVEDVKGTVGTMLSSAKHTEDTTDAMHPVVNETYLASLKMIQTVEAQAGMIEAQAGMIKVLREDIRKSQWNYKRGFEKNERHLQNLTVAVQTSNLSRNMNNNMLAKDAARRPPSRQTFTQDDLEDLLGFNLRVVEQDAQSIMTVGKRSEASAQSRGHWLLRYSKFQDWLTTKESKGLLVNGNENGSDKVSSMSNVVALLAQSLREAESAVTVSFFCGLHVATNDPLSGVIGLMRSLTSQLLSDFDFNLDFIDNECKRQLQQLDIEYLAYLFRSLVEQLSEDRVLFCLIDGISFFEKSIDKGEVDVLMRTLTELTRNCDDGPIFKFLITSPLMSRRAKDFLPMEARIFVPTNAGNGHPINFAQAGRSLNKQVLSKEVELQHVSDNDESEEELLDDSGNFSASSDEDDQDDTKHQRP